MSNKPDRAKGPVTRVAEALIVYGTLALAVWIYGPTIRQQAVDATTRYALEVAQGYARESLLGSVAMKVLGIEMPKADAPGGIAGWLGKYVTIKDKSAPGPNYLDIALRQRIAPALGPAVQADAIKTTKGPTVLASRLNADGTSTLDVEIEVDAGGAARVFRATALEAANGAITIQSLR